MEYIFKQLQQISDTDHTALQQRYDDTTIAKLDPPPQTCQLVPGLSLTTSRCEIPYYASSFTASAAIPSPSSSTTTSIDTSVVDKSAAS